MNSSEDAPMMVNRETRPGYWDYPLDRLPEQVPLIPAHAGIQGHKRRRSRPWIPAFREDERR